MAYAPIAFTIPNYRDYKNFWLKAYEPSTTTPKLLALDSEGDITVIKLELNKDGFPQSAGGALVIPYIDGRYDLYAFPTKSDADANDTTNALRFADNVLSGVDSSGLVLSFNTLEDAVNSTDLSEGDTAQVSGNGGGAMWDVVLTSSVTPNNDDIFQSIAIPTLSLVRRDDTRIENNLNSIERITNEFIADDNFATISKPDLFSWTPDFNIYKTRAGYSTSFDFKAKKVTGATYYVDFENGSDSNTGTKTDDALKTINFALQQSGDLDLVLLGGLHKRSSIPSVTIQKNFNLRAFDENNKPKISVIDDSVVWSKTGGFTNVYQYTASITPLAHSFDAFNTDSFGVYERLKAQASIADVDANPGSIFIDGLIAYVHTVNSRPADEDIRVFLNDENFVVAGQNTVYLENIIFEGGSVGAFSASGVDGEVEVYNVGCQFNYAGGGEGGVRAKGFGRFYSKNSGAHENNQDGFNYKFDGLTAIGRFLEDNCVATRNGESDIAQNDQGSTTHDGIIGVRVGCVYDGNASQGIGDITAGSESWNIGCTASNCYTTNPSFNCGIIAFDGAKVFVDDCETFGNTFSVRVEVNAEMYINGADKLSEPSPETTVGFKDFNDNDLVQGVTESLDVRRDLSIGRNITSDVTIKRNAGYFFFLDRTENAIIDKVGAVGVSGSDINNNFIQWSDTVSQAMQLGISTTNFGNLSIAGAYSPFTGTHIYWSSEDIEVGLAVELVNANERIVTGIKTDGKIKLCNTEASKVCCGLIESRLVMGDKFVYLVAQVGDNRTNKLKGFVISEPVEAGNILITSTGGKLKNATGNEGLSVVKFKAMETQTDISKPVYGYFL